MNTTMPQRSANPSEINPKSQHFPADTNRAITKCGLQIVQAVHDLGTAFAIGGIAKKQAAFLVEEGLGLTKEQREFFWRIHQTYVIAPTEAGVPVHRPYLISIDFQVLDVFRFPLGAWGCDENRLHSNIVVEADSIRCKFLGQGTCDLSRMTVEQARDFEYLPEPDPSIPAHESANLHDLSQELHFEVSMLDAFDFENIGVYSTDLGLGV